MYSFLWSEALRILSEFSIFLSRDFDIISKANDTCNSGYPRVKIPDLDSNGVKFLML
jgi:hypothetical protein